ncbi:MAG: type II secretion system protein F, partial [Mesorhizobium sp.]
MTTQTLLYFIYMLAAASVILAGEAMYLSYASRRSRTTTINLRMKRLAD